MKKFMYGLILLIGVCFTVHAGAVTQTTTNFGVVAWEYLDSATNVYRAGSGDSVLGVDTSDLFVKKVYSPGCVYAVVTKDSVGAADTIAIEYVTYRKTSSGSYIEVMTGLCDTIVPVEAAGSFYRMSNVPIGQTAWGSYFTVRAVGWISGKIAKVRRAYLLVGRPVYGSYGVPQPTVR